jgi:hypothetical protein
VHFRVPLPLASFGEGRFARIAGEPAILPRVATEG